MTRTASRELRLLRDAIQRTKERNMLAFKELQILTELLSPDSVSSPAGVNPFLYSTLFGPTPRKHPETLYLNTTHHSTQVQCRPDVESTLASEGPTGVSESTPDESITQKETIESLSTRLCECNENLVAAQEREEAANAQITDLLKALQEMQEQKNTLQRDLAEIKEKSKDQDDLHDQLQKQVVQLKQDLQSAQQENARLQKIVDTKEEENIQLRITVLQVQENLSKDNSHKDSVIEERERYIEELEGQVKILTDLHLEGEEKEKIQHFEELCKKQENNIKNLERLLQESELTIQKLQSDSLLKDKEYERLKYENSTTKCRITPNGTCQNGNLYSNIQQDGCNNKSPTTSPSKKNGLQRILEAEQRAQKADERADQLNMLLAQKTIEMSKLQLTISSQSKDLVQLEKAYFQLRCHLRSRHSGDSVR